MYASHQKSNLDNGYGRKENSKTKHEHIRGSLYMHEPIMHYDRMTLLKKSDNFAFHRSSVSFS